MNNAIRLLLVDDEPLVLRGLRMCMSAEADICVLDQAADGPEALRLAADLLPDVVVMDLHIGPEDGLAITRQLVGLLPAIRVVVHSMQDDLRTRAAALAAGAVAFTSKADGPDRLLQAIRDAMAAPTSQTTTPEAPLDTTAEHHPTPHPLRPTPKGCTR